MAWAITRKLGAITPQPTQRAIPAAVIAAAVPLMASFQPADAPFDPRTPVVPPPAPPWLFMGQALGRLGPGFGPDHLLHPRRGGIRLVRGGMEAPIAGQQPRRAVAHAPMMGQTRRPWRVLGRVAVQYGVPTDAPALALVQPDDAAEFGGLPGCAWADQGRVGCKQAHPCFRGRQGFPLHDSSGRLRDHRAHQRDDVVQGISQFLAWQGRLHVAQCLHLLRWPHGRLRDVEPVLRRGVPPVVINDKQGTHWPRWNTPPPARAPPRLRPRPHGLRAASSAAQAGQPAADLGAGRSLLCRGRAGREAAAEPRSPRRARDLQRQPSPPPQTLDGWSAGSPLVRRGGTPAGRPPWPHAGPRAGSRSRRRSAAPAGRAACAGPQGEARPTPSPAWGPRRGR